MTTTSSHLSWLIIRNNNSYLLKRPNIKKPFSTEPNNLTNLSSYRYSGLVHRKSVGVVPTSDKKGFTVVMKKDKYQNRPSKSLVRTTMKAGPRRSLKKLRNLVLNSKYRYDLKQAALRRASAILRSQKVRPDKKARGTRKLE